MEPHPRVPQTPLPSAFDEALIEGTTRGTWFHSFLEWLILTYDLPRHSYDAIPGGTWGQFVMRPLFEAQPDLERYYGGDGEAGAAELYRSFHDTMRDVISCIPVEKTIDFAFVSGHGGVDGLAEQVHVPAGMTIRYASVEGDSLLFAHGLHSIAAGRNVRTFQEYNEYDTMPNYRMSPLSDPERQAECFANSGSEQFFFIGEDPLPAGATHMCTTPGECPPARHTCDGVLARLGHVRNLVSVSCRWVYQGPDSVGWRLPEEKGRIPRAAMRMQVNEVVNDFAPREFVSRRVGRAGHERALQLIADPVVQEKVLITTMLNFAKEYGPLAYYARYLAYSEDEREGLDSSGRLTAAREAAETYVAELTGASQEERLGMLDAVEADERAALLAILPDLFSRQEPSAADAHRQRIRAINATAFRHMPAAPGESVPCVYGSGVLVLPHGVREPEDVAAVERIRGGPHLVARIRLTRIGTNVLAHVEECPESDQVKVKGQLLEILQGETSGRVRVEFSAQDPRLPGEDAERRRERRRYEEIGEVLLRAVKEREEPESPEGTEPPAVDQDTREASGTPTLIGLEESLKKREWFSAGVGKADYAYCLAALGDDRARVAVLGACLATSRVFRLVRMTPMHASVNEKACREGARKFGLDTVELQDALVAALQDEGVRRVVAKLAELGYTGRQRKSLAAALSAYAGTMPAAAAPRQASAPESGTTAHLDALVVHCFETVTDPEQRDALIRVLQTPRMFDVARSVVQAGTVNDLGEKGFGLLAKARALTPFEVHDVRRALAAPAVKAVLSELVARHHEEGVLMALATRLRDEI
ncbi:putative adhesin [Streptomyces erythrochromogenes]|uniref:putative adhesin n=1 Tax=Streptomyces erythrochromogenes TaxID=285574 RepID=UPI003423ADEE